MHSPIEKTSFFMISLWQCHTTRHCVLLTRLLLGCHDVGVPLQVERMAGDSRFSLRLQRPSGPQGHLPLPQVSYTHTALPLSLSLAPLSPVTLPFKAVHFSTILIKSVTAYKVLLHLLQVADRPVSSCAGAQGPVCAPEANLALVKEMHTVFGPAPLFCVFCISSLFPGLVDCSSEQHCTPIAAALAAELVGQRLQSDRPRQPV